MTPEQLAGIYDAFNICVRRWMGTWLDLFLTRLWKRLLNQELKGLVKEDFDISTAMRQLEANDGALLASHSRSWRVGCWPARSCWGSSP